MINKFVEKLRVDRTLMEKFQKKYLNSKWYWPTFSCNPNHEVWECDSYSKTKVKKGVDHNDFPFIEDIVERALLIRPEGGRFHVKDDHAVYANLVLRICEIELV